MRQSLFLLILMLMSLPTWGKSTHLIRLQNGQRLKVDLHEYVNGRGIREMRIDSADMANVTLGFGRDINRNGTIDTFFLKGKDGLHIFRNEAPGVSSKLMALRYLAVHAQYAGKHFYQKLATDFLGLLFISMDVANRAQQTYIVDYMDLEELRIAASDKSQLLNRAEKIYVLNLLLKGHEIAHGKLQLSLRRANLLIAADALLWLGGGILLKGALKTVGARRIAAGASASLAARISVNSFPAAMKTAQRGLLARTLLSRSKSIIIKGLKGIRKEWRYITFSTGIQLGVEGYVNYHEIKDANPAIQAQNMLADKTIRENVAISVTDSLLMAGALNTTKNKKIRFALLGMIGASTSLGVGTALNGNQNTTRVAFDSAWAVGIDTTSVMVELKALHHFQEKAIRTRNPRLKIVGYAIVFVSQVAGYWGYSEATKMIESKADLKEGQVMMVPVTASVR